MSSVASPKPVRRRVLRRRVLSEEEKEENKKLLATFPPFKSECYPFESHWEALGIPLHLSGSRCHSCQKNLSSRDIDKIPVEKMWEIGMDCGYVWCAECCDKQRVRCTWCASLTTEEYKNIFPSSTPHVWVKEWL